MSLVGFGELPPNSHWKSAIVITPGFANNEKKASICQMEAGTPVDVAPRSSGNSPSQSHVRCQIAPTFCKLMLSPLLPFVGLMSSTMESPKETVCFEGAWAQEIPCRSVWPDCRLCKVVLQWCKMGDLSSHDQPTKSKTQCLRHLDLRLAKDRTHAFLMYNETVLPG